MRFLVSYCVPSYPHSSFKIGCVSLGLPAFIVIDADRVKLQFTSCFSNLPCIFSATSFYAIFHFSNSASTLLLTCFADILKRNRKWPCSFLIGDLKSLSVTVYFWTKCSSLVLLCSKLEESLKSCNEVSIGTSLTCDLPVEIVVTLVVPSLRGQSSGLYVFLLSSV